MCTYTCAYMSYKNTYTLIYTYACLLIHTYTHFGFYTHSHINRNSGTNITPSDSPLCIDVFAVLPCHQSNSDDTSYKHIVLWYPLFHSVKAECVTALWGLLHLTLNPWTWTSTVTLVLTAVRLCHFLGFARGIQGNSLCTWILQVLISFSPGLGHVSQCKFHDLDVGDRAVALWELLSTLAATLAVLTDILSLAIAHDVTQGRLNKLLLQILREDYL